jgi:hypothetical protein
MDRLNVLAIGLYDEVYMYVCVCVSVCVCVCARARVLRACVRMYVFFLKLLLLYSLIPNIFPKHLESILFSSDWEVNFSIYTKEQV